VIITQNFITGIHSFYALEKFERLTLNQAGSSMSRVSFLGVV